MVERNERPLWPTAATLAEAIAHARAAWPALHVGEEAFSAYVAERLPRYAERGGQALTPSRLEELYLACACALGEPAAIRAFERTYFDEVEAVAARLRGTGVRGEDLRQQVRDRLFVAAGAAPPRIATYAGEGELRSWVRAVSMRAALNMTRGGARDKNRLDESTLLELPDLADDPELGFMKRRYRADFDAAVSDAFSALSVRDRNVLTYATVDKLSTAAIGSIYRVHRTTVKRWLEEAEQALLGKIRASMMDRLRVSRAELESILRLVRSRLDLRLADRAVAQAN